MMRQSIASDACFASLAGSAIGDALGLPYENLSARRAARLLGEPDRFRFALGRGMVSDDAEHACMAAAAFAASGGDVERFRRDLARRLRWWLLTIPVGVGLATLRSIVKLWLGASPSRSGVWSAGNGPAMRAAILGRLCRDDALFAFVEASSTITHRDPRATLGAFAVAVASRAFAEASNDEDRRYAGRARTRAGPASDARDPGRREYALPRRVGTATDSDVHAPAIAKGPAGIDASVPEATDPNCPAMGDHANAATSVPSVRATIDAVADAIRDDLDSAGLLALLERVAASVAHRESTEAFAASICLRRGRISGFVYETVPVALHAAFAHGGAIDAVRAAIRCGGDSDSVASIVGGIRGVDEPAMLARLIEWPCNARWLRELAAAAADRTEPPRLPWASRVPRNALQLAIVLVHVGRRALPPY